jgi:hypothetical protein
MRRPPKETAEGTDPMDADGLSVFDAAQIDIDECIEQNSTCYGLATLHVGTMRDLGLTVRWDPEDPRKVLIVDMPLAWISTTPIHLRFEALFWPRLWHLGSRQRPEIPLRLILSEAASKDAEKRILII